MAEKSGTTGTAAADSPLLVTGATGFLGSHLLTRLLEGGAAVRILTREPAPGLEERGVEVVVGSMESEDALAKAVSGVRGVFHLAGRVSRNPDAGAEMNRLHIEGGRRLAAAAKNAGVGRVVLVSTSGTIAVSRFAEPERDETAPVPVDLIGGWPYYRSKWLQERAFLESAGDGFEVVIVGPSLLLGPGDARLSSTGDVLRFLSGQIRVTPPGGLNFVDVRDAAATVAAAMERGRAGERYLVGGPNWTFGEFFSRLGEVAGLAAPRLRPPASLYRVGGLASEELARRLGREPVVDRISREMAGVFWFFSSAKAERELGHRAREGIETLHDTVRWLRGREASA